MDDLEDRIRRKAHELWLAEGMPEGKEAEHWFRAQDHVRTEDYEDIVANPCPAAEAECPPDVVNPDPAARRGKPAGRPTPATVRSLLQATAHRGARTGGNEAPASRNGARR
jgi:hypothetical protein